jgi:hypothetical protein
MDKVASNKCFFQDDALLNGKKTKRNRHHLPEFPDPIMLALIGT